MAVGALRRFAALAGQDKWLLLRAAAVVAVVRTSLWLFPFRWVCGCVSSHAAYSPPGNCLPMGRAAWAVQAVARRIPDATCLTQALALHWLLQRAGQSSTLHIGVAKSEARGFEAHAWIESGGVVLLEEREEVSRFVPILALSAGGQ